MYTLLNLNKNIKTPRCGFTLLEMLVALAIASFIFVIIVNLLSVYLRSYATFQAVERVNAAGIVAMERMTREIKLATNVNNGSSTFDTHPGKLLLDTTIGGSAATIEFYLDGETLKIKKDGVVTGALTGERVSVDTLIFSLVGSGSSQLIKIEMDISTGSGSSTKSALFLTSALLRGTY